MNLLGILCILLFASYTFPSILPETHSELGLATKSPHQLVLSSFIEIPTHSFLISTNQGRVDQRQVDQRIQYNPTFGPNVGVMAQYKAWHFSLSKRLTFIDEQEQEKYGRSDYNDWRAGYQITKYFFVETYYQNYKGFYTDLSGEEGLQTSFGGGQRGMTASDPKNIISRPDISALNYGLRAIFALPLTPLLNFFNSMNNRDSVDWEFNILTKIYYNHLRIAGDQPLVPPIASNSFSPIASLEEYSTNTLGLGMGLGVIVPASSTVSIGFDAMLGSGFQRQVNEYADYKRTKYTNALEMNSNLYFNWKNQNHGFRTGFYWDTYSSKVDGVNFDSSNLGLNLIYSYSGIKL